MTTTKKSIEHWREIIDLYVELHPKHPPETAEPVRLCEQDVAGHRLHAGEYLDFYEQCWTTSLS